MEIADITSIILTVLGTVYVPYWIYQQTIKNSRAKEINSEIVEIKLMLKDTTVRHEVRLDSHETRITNLENVA
jgi:hypothetical protein